MRNDNRQKSEIHVRPETAATVFFIAFVAIFAHGMITIRSNKKRRSQAKASLSGSEHIARTMQDALTPLCELNLDGLDIALSHRLQTAPGLAKIGGDFYDLFLLPNGEIGFAIGDISGHGIDAAAYHGMVRGAIRALGLQNLEPAVVMSAVNKYLCSEFKSGLFVTAVYGKLSVRTGDITMCIAGHPKPFILLPSGIRDFRSVQSPLLGFAEDGKYTSFVFRLEENESIVLYTDGITEAHNESGEEFGFERLVESMVHNRGKTPDDTVAALFNIVDDFCGKKEPNDDRAIIAIRREKFRG